MKFMRILVMCGLAAAPFVASAAYSLSTYQNFVTGSWADAVAVGDINGDGRQDVVLTTGYLDNHENDFKVFVFFQNSSGTLDAPRKYSYAPAGIGGLALADLDRDGRMDIVVGHGTGVTILRWGMVHGGMGMRSRLLVSGREANDVAIIDVDRDGALDVIAQSWSDDATIYYGDGYGGISRQTLLETPAQGYNDVESGDLNNDGYDDLVVFTGQGPTHAYVYYNDGSDDFSDPLDVNPNPDALATIGAIGIGDFNADGRNDLVAMRDSENLSLFYQNAQGGLDGVITVPSASFPNALLGYDLDNDNRDDLVVLHGSGAVGIYLQGDGGLAPEIASNSPVANWLNSQGIVAGDINGDGCADVVSANYNAGLVVHLGNGCSPATDLAVGVGLTSTTVAIRLDNFGPDAAADPGVTTALSVASGILDVGALPSGCSMQSQSSRDVLVQCDGTSLDAGASRTLLLSISVNGGDRHNMLTASVEARTPTADRYLPNNRGGRKIRLQAFASPAQKILPSGRPASSR